MFRLMLHYATRHATGLRSSLFGVTPMILFAIFAIGCGATRPSPRDAGSTPDGAADEPAASTVATYGALTGVGLGAGAVGAYVMAEAGSHGGRTGSRPEFWGGFQAVAGGAALAIPFGYLTASSLAGSDDSAENAARAARPRSREGFRVQPRVGAGSIDLTGEF